MYKLKVKSITFVVLAHRKHGFLSVHQVTASNLSSPASRKKHKPYSKYHITEVLKIRKKLKRVIQRHLIYLVTLIINYVFIVHSSML